MLTKAGLKVLEPHHPIAAFTPHTPMSAARPCTRATAQRLAIRLIRSKRFASTETLAVEPAEPILPAKVEQQSTWKPDLSQRLHKALYPDLYKHGEPKIEALRMSIRRKQPKKPIDAKWQPVMQQKAVNRTLSTLALP
jgi:large subunit ribosomal protein L19